MIPQFKTPKLLITENGQEKRTYEMYCISDI